FTLSYYGTRPAPARGWWPRPGILLRRPASWRTIGGRPGRPFNDWSSPIMSRLRLALLAPFVLLLGVALPVSAADNVPRGPSHEPVPFRYDPAAWKDVPKA